MGKLQGASVLFAGDSVTDCGRREDPRGLGDGYVSMLAAELGEQGATVANVGIGGDRVVDLQQRWSADVVGGNADVLSILVGINDTGAASTTATPPPPKLLRPATGIC